MVEIDKGKALLAMAGVAVLRRVGQVRLLVELSAVRVFVTVCAEGCLKSKALCLGALLAVTVIARDGEVGILKFEIGVLVALYVVACERPTVCAVTALTGGGTKLSFVLVFVAVFTTAMRYVLEAFSILALLC